MIPKVIHYCWFGKNPLPKDALKCIASWKKYCPGYEIKQWNESNFDINCCDYVKEAYEAKKWAFVSDFARFWILYNYGGLYFDTDVELIKTIDDLVSKGAFMGEEPCGKGVYRIAAGLVLCASAGNLFYKEVLKHYRSIHFKQSERVYNDETVVTYITRLAKKHGFKGNGRIETVGNITIYPPRFFCPMNPNTGQMKITNNTRSIHWYSASWKDEKEASIHNRAIEIYKKRPNLLGKILGSIYECIMKLFYYAKKEGMVNLIRRVVRKMKKNK